MLIVVYAHLTFDRCSLLANCCEVAESTLLQKSMDVATALTARLLRESTCYRTPWSRDQKRERGLRTIDRCAILCSIYIVVTRRLSSSSRKHNRSTGGPGTIRAFDIVRTITSRRALRTSVKGRSD